MLNMVVKKDLTGKGCLSRKWKRLVNIDTQVLNKIQEQTVLKSTLKGSHTMTKWDLCWDARMEPHMQIDTTV